MGGVISFSCCISHLLLLIKSPQPSKPYSKCMLSYYLSVCESRIGVQFTCMSLAQVPFKAPTKCLLGLPSPQGSIGSEPTSKLSHMAVARPRSLLGFCLGTSFPNHVGLCVVPFTAWQLASLGAKEWKREPKMEATVFCNLISEVASHHFCGILYVERKSVRPPDTQEEGVTVGLSTKRWISLGTCLS